MKILYFHGFAARLNGRKATCLRAHFGQNAVIEPPPPGFPYSKTQAAAFLTSLRQRFGMEPREFLNLLGSNRLAAMARLSPEVVNSFTRAVQIAQQLYDQVHPDLIVGSSLGGSVAMTINSGDTPMVLIDPVWNPNIKYAMPAYKLPVAGPIARSLVAGAIATFRTPISQLAGFAVHGQIKAATVILHSAHDHLFDVSHSHTLLRNSPISPDDPRRGPMNRVIETLSASGYGNQKCDAEADFNDGRLIVIGKDHHSNEIDPDDRKNRDPHPHNALIAAARALLEQFAFQ